MVSGCSPIRLGSLSFSQLLSVLSCFYKGCGALIPGWRESRKPPREFQGPQFVDKECDLDESLSQIQVRCVTSLNKLVDCVRPIIVGHTLQVCLCVV